MTLGPGSKRSKVAPRRHWSSIHGLIVQSRQLNRMLRTGDEGEQTLMARSSQSRRLSLIRMAAPTAGTAPAKPLVFRKTKREIQREREQQLALQRQQEKEADEQKQQERLNACAKHELDQLQLLAACKSAIRLTCRSQYLQRQTRTGLGLERRCPPRRRLLF